MEADALGRGILGKQCLLLQSDCLTVLMHFAAPTVLLVTDLILFVCVPVFPPPPQSTAGLVQKGHII